MNIPVSTKSSSPTENRVRILLLLATTTYRTDDFMDAVREVGVPADVVVGAERRNALEAQAGGGTIVVDFEEPANSLQTVLDYHTFRPFAWYRILVGGALLILVSAGAI